MPTIDDVEISGLNDQRRIDLSVADIEHITLKSRSGTVRLDLDQAKYLHERLAERIPHLEQESDPSGG